MRLQTKLWSCRDHGFKDSDIHPFIPQLFIEPLLCAGTVDSAGNQIQTTAPVLMAYLLARETGGEKKAQSINEIWNVTW